MRIVIENQVVYHNTTYSSHNIIDNNNTNVNEDKQTKLSSQKAYFSVPLLRNKCFVLSLVLFLLILGILIVVLIGGNEHINNLKNNLQIKKKLIVERENQTNQTMEQLIETITKLQKQNDQTVKDFNKTLTELNKNNQTIKELNSLSWRKSETIEQLNKKLIEIKQTSKINNHW
jgi:uncharacterized protein HemX